MKKDYFCDRAMEFILTRRNEDLSNLSIAQVARELNVSRSYLARVFKKERSFTLKEYLLREKMIRSTFLLIREPELSINELAKRIGFLDTGYFAYIFKKYFGISPGKYRECKKRLRITEKNELNK